MDAQLSVSVETGQARRPGLPAAEITRISCPTPEEGGASVELSLGGSRPITQAGTGEQRTFPQEATP